MLLIQYLVGSALIHDANCRSLTGPERNLLWRFRWSLTGDRQALTRVLQCVDWQDVQEARQAAELMASWCAIGVADALELLSPAFPQPEVGVNP